MSNSISAFALPVRTGPSVVRSISGLQLRTPPPPTRIQANKRSYQKQSAQLAAPPGRIQSQEEQRSRKKGEQKQVGFRDRYETIDHSPAESPPQ